MNCEPRLIVATLAGRRRYLTLLSRYVLASPDVDEWQIWDNCRNESDRAYLLELARLSPKVRLVRLDGADGTLRIIADCYRLLDDPGAFYIKLDDDIVYLDPDFFRRFRARALAERGRALWFAPLVVNNAITSWLLKYTSPLSIDAPLTCQANCPIGWQSPQFAESLHRLFLEAHAQGRLDQFRVGDHAWSLGRFSINALGFFGADKSGLGDAFCPDGVDDEEWISSVLAARGAAGGRIFGDLLAVHFSYFPQEAHLAKTDVLAGYYRLHGLPDPPPFRVAPPAAERRRRFWKRKRVPAYRLALAPDGCGAGHTPGSGQR